MGSGLEYRPITYKNKRVYYVIDIQNELTRESCALFLASDVFGYVKITVQDGVFSITDNQDLDESGKIITNLLTYDFPLHEHHDWHIVKPLLEKIGHVDPQWEDWMNCVDSTIDWQAEGYE